MCAVMAVGADGTRDSLGDDDESRARARALLEATHQFPCAYEITVIAFNLEPITEAVRKEAGITGSVGTIGDAGVATPGSEGGYRARPSREGKYLSHKFSVPVGHAGEVLELYARLRSVDGVVTIL